MIDYFPDSCSPLSQREKFYRNDNVGPSSEAQGEGVYSISGGGRDGRENTRPAFSYCEKVSSALMPLVPYSHGEGGTEKYQDIDEPGHEETRVEEGD